jgi:hypothetical protein
VTTDVCLTYFNSFHSPRAEGADGVLVPHTRPSTGTIKIYGARTTHQKNAACRDLPGLQKVKTFAISLFSPTITLN